MEDAKLLLLPDRDLSGLSLWNEMRYYVEDGFL